MGIWKKSILGRRNGIFKGLKWEHIGDLNKQGCQCENGDQAKWCR